MFFDNCFKGSALFCNKFKSFWIKNQGQLSLHLWKIFRVFLQLIVITVRIHGGVCLLVMASDYIVLLNISAVPFQELCLLRGANSLFLESQIPFGEWIIISFVRKAYKTCKQLLQKTTVFGRQNLYAAILRCSK